VTGTAPGSAEILANLVAFESVSAASNLPINAYISDYLGGFGIVPTVIPDPTGSKASLLATVGSGAGPGIVLSAHTDVVPTEGQAWTSPPFTASARDGRIYGRGTSDMKGFIAAVLAAVPSFQATATACPIHIALSYDEEVGCRGAPDLARAVAALPTRPALCIVGEPTGLRVARAHKGKVARRIRVSGKGGHSALPHQAVNAIDAAVRIAAGLRELGEELVRGPRNPDYDPPWTTLHIGSLHGGGALNLVPDAATLEFEIRSVPGTDTETLLRRVDVLVASVDAELRALDPAAGVSVEEMAAYPALEMAGEAPELAALAELVGDAHPGITLSFGTEAGIYAQAGIPTLVCGPGDIGRAHKADEWIGLDELAAADRMMQRLAEACRRPAGSWLST
jgi:acetylornithine deacetylase